MCQAAYWAMNQKVVEDHQMLSHQVTMYFMGNLHELDEYLDEMY